MSTSAACFGHRRCPAGRLLLGSLRLALAVLLLPPLDGAAETVRSQVQTAAGELRIIQLDEGPLGGRFRIDLAGKTVLETDIDRRELPFFGFPAPQIQLHVRAGVAPFVQTVVFQQHGWGNACNGGPLWVLGLRRDGTWATSDSIPYCGGGDPRLTVKRDRIIITLPGGPPNRGTGAVKADAWEFHDGRVARVGEVPGKAQSTSRPGSRPP